MCGIAGYTHKGGVFPRGRMRRLVESLKHRGPDQHGVFESQDISLGTARLKIIDLESGCQPMTSEDGTTVIVFNGEVYNYKELRQHLESLGHRFFSRSDTEVILRAFLEWDTRFLVRLRGMFSIALWVGPQKRLVLARDRLGIKPLYVYRQGADLCFASELKAILAHPEVGGRLNLAGLDSYLTLNYLPGPQTLVEKIEKLPPGHFLEWCDGKVRTQAYWRLIFCPEPRRDLSSTQEELDFLLRQSVREHLISDVPLGIWLSGGIDSSTILHYATAERNSRLKTFSISFRGRSFDESRHFRGIAQRYGTEHHELDLNPQMDLASAVEDLVYYSDEPGADAGALPLWYLARMSREHITVALSGEGADELFGGYLTYAADRYARIVRRLPVATRRGILRWLRHWPVSDDKISLEYKLKRFLEGSLLAPGEAHLFWNGSFSRSAKAALLPAADDSAVEALLQELPPESVGRLNRFLWFDQRYYLPDNILCKVDRTSMAHSLEVRPPFLDHRIVELAASLPERFKIRGFRRKVVLRELMKDKLPSSTLRRKKEGLDIPAHDWLRTALRPLLLDTLNAQTVRQTGLFRWEAVRFLLAEHLERRANLGYQLWGLLILFLWIKRWKILTTPVVEEKLPRSAGVLALN